jgi:hypothetical protein
MRPLPIGVDPRIPTINVIRELKRLGGLRRVAPTVSTRRRPGVCWSYRLQDADALKTWLKHNPDEPDAGPTQLALF